MHVVVLVVALLIAVPGAALAQTDDLDPRVLVMPVEGAPPPALRGLGEDVAAAMVRGAGRMTPTVTRATASLSDTAVIVGCEPGEPECLDAVAAALNVDQLLLATIAASGDDATIEVTAVTREADPVRQTFTVHLASRSEDMAALEEAVPAMLEAGEARKNEKKEIVVQPPPPDPQPPLPAPVVEGRRNIAPLAVAGGGGALILAGAVFWALASSTQGQIDDAPTETVADLERLADLEDTARQRATIGNVLVIGGAVVAAGGVTWYLLDRRRDREVRAAPLLVPGGAGVAIGGAW